MPAVIFLGPSGGTRQEEWFAGAVRAAAIDLVGRLGRSGFEPVTAVVADGAARSALGAAGAEILESESGAFHFGRALAAIPGGSGSASIAYFGAASAPLASEAHLRTWRQLASDLEAPAALVNNLHSTDWALLSDRGVLASIADRLPTDNALGWVLRNQAGVSVSVVPMSAASRADIDTPGDLALMRNHPDLGPHLRQFMSGLPAGLIDRTDGLVEALRAPAQTVALIGRVSAEIWQETVRRTQVWLRVFAEERGMRASRRQERGEVRSLIAEMVDDLGPQAFLRKLATMTSAGIWDTRVWMAQSPAWPSAADRYASDLGWVDEIEHESLRGLSRAIEDAGFPLVTGGHGVVAGSLLALLESFPEEEPGVADGYQPSR
jgi:hypothetical protein